MAGRDKGEFRVFLILITLPSFLQSVILLLDSETAWSALSMEPQQCTLQSPTIPLQLLLLSKKKSKPLHLVCAYLNVHLLVSFVSYFVSLFLCRSLFVCLLAFLDLHFIAYLLVFMLVWLAHFTCLFVDLLFFFLFRSCGEFLFCSSAAVWLLAINACLFVCLFD